MLAATRAALDIIQEAREACGGQGFLAENRLVQLRADLDIYATFEGDNNVLLQLVAKRLLTDYSRAFGRADAGVMAHYVAGQVNEAVVNRSGLRRLALERAGLERLLEESRLAREASERRSSALSRELEETKRAFAADREKLEVQLGELVELRRQVEALRAARDALLAERDAQAAGRGAAEEEVRRLVARIQSLGAQLALMDRTLADKQAEIDRQGLRIAELGQRLNQALANRVEELAQYRSDFFGRLRRVLGDREDVRIVGDRFVFQSEVLFAPGEAELGPGAAAEIAKLAATLRQIANEIPPELPWVLQVDGHTDRRPIATPRFPSNWELSTARAISVVRQLMALGIPAERLAARGFGEFQPLDPGDGEEAWRRNRRIELKLTTR